jgi:hypothetical protein
MLKVPCILMQTRQSCGFREGIRQPLPLDPGVGADMRANVTEDDFEVDRLRPDLIFLLEDVSVADRDAEAALVIEFKLKGPQEHPPYSTSYQILPIRPTKWQYITAGPGCCQGNFYTARFKFFDMK